MLICAGHVWCLLLCAPHPPPQLTLPYVLDICVQLTSGLRHLHAACGIVHRDLKSDNALVAGKDPLVVKWADFGCSVKLNDGTTSATFGTGICRGCVSALLCVCAPTSAVAAACTRHDLPPSPSLSHVYSPDREQLNSTRSWWHHWHGVPVRRSLPISQRA